MYVRAQVAIGVAIVALTMVDRAAAQDCNGNGLNDACDIDCGASGGPCDLPGCGRSDDCNGNARPDECDFAATFQGLGDLPGGAFSSEAFGISADGSTVVGRSTSASGPEAFRWARNGGMVGLNFPPGYYSTEAYGVSADGSTVVGTADQEVGFRWTTTLGMVDLALPGSGCSFGARAASADGSVIVGYGELGYVGSDGGVYCGDGCVPEGPCRFYDAFRWTTGGGMALGLPPGPGTKANDVSADGSVVVGADCSFSVPYIGFYYCKPFRWTLDEGTVSLSHLPEENFFHYSVAYAVSADGSFVVGTGLSPAGSTMAFRWASDGGVVWLGDLPGEFSSRAAHGVSGDGSIIVGIGSSGSETEAFIWDTANGMRSLRAVLVDQYGLDLTGWTLTSAQDISTDGRTIVGYGTNPDGFTEAWIATLPSEDADANGVPDECDVSTQTVPTMSVWGMAVTALLLLTAAKVSFRRRPATPRAA